MREDEVVLVETGESSEQRRHRRGLLGLCSVLVVLVIILVGECLGLYFRTSGSVRILSLNVWGLPSSLGSLDKADRIQRIAEILLSEDFDVVYLVELWEENDWKTLESALEGKYIMTSYSSMNPCNPTFAPMDCSGLALLSKHPILELDFNPYSDRGDKSHVSIDGEYLVNKGVGRARLSINHNDNITIDFFFTHTIAEPPVGSAYSNGDIRLKQVFELMHSRVLPSKADLVILGGDFNSSPSNKSYKYIKNYMQHSALDFFREIRALFNSAVSTYANPDNNWSRNITKPDMLDHIFYKTNNERVSAWTQIFSVPLLHFFDKEGKRISVSDHEAVVAKIYYKKRSDKFPYF